MEVRIIGKMDNTLDNTFESANRVYDSNGLSPNLLTCSGGNIQPKVLEVEVLGDIGEKKYDCVAMRGRGDSNEQTLEINSNGLVNSITTVQKDNLVMIRQNIKDGLIPCKIGGGGRFELPRKQNAQRTSNRKRRSMSDSDNGEYP